MINFKKEVAMLINSVTDIPVEELETYIEIPKDNNMGDYAFPCFRLAKVLKKSPAQIASEIKEKITNIPETIEKI